MKTSPLLVVEMFRELDLHLELDSRSTLALPPSFLSVSGLRPGEPISVELHPLSLRLENLKNTSPLLLPQDRPIALLGMDGRLQLPCSPPFLTGRRVVLQVRHRGLIPEVHLIGDCR